MNKTKGCLIANFATVPAPLCQPLDDAAQVIKVACQPVHAMHHHGVALADEGQQPFQLGTLGVLARSLVGEHPRHLNTLQLPFRVLVEAADADIADALTLQDASKGKSVRMKSITFDGICQSIGNLTLF
ncbi:hypothetical protein SCH_028 (plasmid) [Salmonella enterica subsp. enterica serovar Choleraesuis str. SC-B67]|uniref:Uncharacterized protein n=1 Tax=Salmonella choleraesuis (strain SC-B67) TaxID=321314 RepID=Q5J453_SALCH|nr:hypothetical protein SCH_028 [Salmonella enterica subsp. enterica serovar Choleraesuis str. SC-B67]